jgi:hypothetical protein
MCGTFLSNASWPDSADRVAGLGSAPILLNDFTAHLPSRVDPAPPTRAPCDTAGEGTTTHATMGYATRMASSGRRQLNPGPGHTTSHKGMCPEKRASCVSGRNAAPSGPSHRLAGELIAARPEGRLSSRRAGSPAHPAGSRRDWGARGPAPPRRAARRPPARSRPRLAPRPRPGRRSAAARRSMRGGQAAATARPGWNAAVPGRRQGMAQAGAGAPPAGGRSATTLNPPANWKVKATCQGCVIWPVRMRVRGRSARARSTPVP